MRLFTQLLIKNACYKAGKKLTVKGIMWHSTGANNPNLKRYVQPDDGTLGTNTLGNHWNTSTPDGRQICPHAFIGKDKNGAVATYQTLPWTMRGWHAGGSANNTHIGFEICEDNLKSVDYFNAVYKEACELSAHLCKMFNLDPLADGVIICHSEGHALGIATNHVDVMHWFSRYGKTMNDVRKDVKALMGTSAPAASSTEEPLYRVQCGAFSKLSNASNFASELKKKGYATLIVNDGKLYKIQCGAFRNRVYAEELRTGLSENGYRDAFITTEEATPVPTGSDSIRVGDVVKVKLGAKSYEGKSVRAYVYAKKYTVDQLKGDRAVLDLRGLCTAFNIKDLKKV